MGFHRGSFILAVFGTTFWSFGSSMLLNFVLVWLNKYFDMSVTDESYLDETRRVLNYNSATFENYYRAFN